MSAPLTEYEKRVALAWFVFRLMKPKETSVTSSAKVTHSATLGWF